MRKKINHHKQCEIRKLLTSDFDKKIIEDRWIFAIKRDLNDEIMRYKTRWVAQSYSQIKSIDYLEFYFEVVKSMLIKIILVLCAKYDYECHHCDIVTAFLKTEIAERTWVRQSIDFEEKDDFES